MKFLGIDFGWQSGASGLCCLSWENDCLQLCAKHSADTSREEPAINSGMLRPDDRRESITDILAWVDAVAPNPQSAIVAVDAPTIITNATGMRTADRLTHKYFGRYHAGAYPASLRSRFADRTVALGRSLGDRGFAHAPTIAKRTPGRYQIEVYPHPAIVNLFGLNQILKYKKGPLAHRQLELAKLHQYIGEILPRLEPPLAPDTIGKIPQVQTKLTLKTFKAIEDQLDALLCAYIGAYWWYWGEERNLVLGNGAEGYIVIPAARAEKLDQ
ncbi:MAG TPA: DUF429 domain-containing protein [Oscillatoriaceae cyanobacterium M33_DOE_052]|uniref:DUF429 domain-containing protein n=1 Tax=Planktothricoides sp. SpSt-374 TaxID=2282167 RepID=A0A7C3VNT9_9CYAN|nr:DUF429 domain-containing protein [Oscillatoriaceae cyanobacterium M33_DOE_052]